MIKKKRRYNPNHIKARRTYTFQELAEVIGTSPVTIMRWQKKGLKVLDPTTKPYYFLGSDIILFLTVQRRKRKHQLKPGEFFCTTCHKPQHSLPDRLYFTITNKRQGKTARQAFIRGICEVCGRSLTLFSTDKIIQKMREQGLLQAEQETASGDTRITINGDRHVTITTDVRVVP